MSFENNIQQWVQVDNKLMAINEQSKLLREKRKLLEKSITDHAKVNNMNDTTIKINDDRIKCIDTKIHEPLTFKYLEKSLSEIIPNETQVKRIMEYIKQHRTTKIVPEIKRIFTN